jgi:hypothetical protein
VAPATPSENFDNSFFSEINGGNKTLKPAHHLVEEIVALRVAPDIVVPRTRALHRSESKKGGLWHCAIRAHVRIGSLKKGNRVKGNVFFWNMIYGSDKNIKISPAQT